MDGPSTFTLGEAAKQIGKSKTTVSKALKSGKLSYREKTKAGYVIEAAELFRAFPVNTKNKKVTDQNGRSVTPNETGGLQVKLEAALEQLRREREITADLQRRLDAESEERRRLTERLLPAPRSSEGIFRKLGKFFSGG